VGAGDQESPSRELGLADLGVRRELGAALGFDDRRGVEGEGVRGRARARRPARADGGSGERGIRNSVGEARQGRFD
jgi:hypothetical protein